MLRAGLAAAEDAAADGDAELPTAAVSETVVDGLFDADTRTLMTTSAPNAMKPLSALCRAGQGLRCRPFGVGVCGGMADWCCHGGG